MIETLSKHVSDTLPGARLEPQPLPDNSQLQLYLLNPDYPKGALNQEQVQTLMDKPFYWVFCWASGQVLAQMLLADPERVRGKRVLDFGCGSGVVAIAAAMAGAAEVIACDIDPLALQATAQNAQLNGVEVALCSDYFAVQGEVDLIIVADVLYDRSNLAWLARFVERAPEVIIADSRIKDFDYPPYKQIGGAQATTLPDLDESKEFGDVRIYAAVEAGC